MEQPDINDEVEIVCYSCASVLRTPLSTCLQLCQHCSAIHFRETTHQQYFNLFIDTAHRQYHAIAKQRNEEVRLRISAENATHSLSEIDARQQQSTPVRQRASRLLAINGIITIACILILEFGSFNDSVNNAFRIFFLITMFLTATIILLLYLDKREGQNERRKRIANVEEAQLALHKHQDKIRVFMQKLNYSELRDEEAFPSL